MFKLEKLEKVLGKDLTDKLRMAFNDAPAPIELQETSLADGSGSISGTIAVGEAITMNGAPVADGTYSLEGGQSIMVMGGVIAEISTPQEEATGNEMPMSKDEILSAIQTALSQQEVKFKAILKAKDEAHALQTKANKEAFSAIVEALDGMVELRQPAPEPKADPRNVFAQKRADSFSKVLQSINKIKTTK